MTQTFNSLADLDELLLACRDQRARSFIFEAIASYKAAAYRSAIVSTWVAICFDFIEKVHELALAGDREAEQLSSQINDARSRGDLTWALKFEKTILTHARDKFELISPLEFIDLERLLEDRNRCAHPSMSADGEPFSPSAELARLHIRSAVTHFLQHPPVQGKAALDRLLAEVESNYFPTDFKKATIAFSTGPMKRPRKSLISNFVIVLLKRAIDDSTGWPLRIRLIAALQAVHELHGISFNEVMQEKLPKLIRAAKDENIYFFLHVIVDFPHLWVFLKPDSIQRLEIYTDKVPPAELDILEGLLNFEPLRNRAERRLSSATLDELQETAWFETPKRVTDRFVAAYVKAKSFDHANRLSKELRMIAPLLDQHQIAVIVAGAANNGEVAESHGFIALLRSIVRAGRMSKTELEKILVNNSFLQHVPLPDD